jgi:hypothetical protein
MVQAREEAKVEVRVAGLATALTLTPFSVIFEPFPASLSLQLEVTSRRSSKEAPTPQVVSVTLAAPP